MPNTLMSSAAIKGEWKASSSSKWAYLCKKYGWGNGFIRNGHLAIITKLPKKAAVYLYFTACNFIALLYNDDNKKSKITNNVKNSKLHDNFPRNNEV